MRRQLDASIVSDLNRSRLPSPVQEEERPPEAILSSDSASLHLRSHGNGLSDRRRIGLTTSTATQRKFAYVIIENSIQGTFILVQWRVLYVTSNKLIVFYWIFVLIFFFLPDCCTMCRLKIGWWMHISNYDCRQLFTHRCNWYTGTNTRIIIIKYVVHETTVARGHLLNGVLSFCFCSAKKRKRPKWLRFLLTTSLTITK